MNTVAHKDVANVVLFVNDYNHEFGTAIKKLELQLNMPLRGVIILDNEVRKLGINKPDLDKEFSQIVCDYDDLSSISKAINSIRHNVLAVICSSERNQPYLKKLLPHLPYCVGPSESSLEWSTHKITMRKMLGSYNESLIPKVVSVSAVTPKVVSLISEQLTYPLIVKPNGLAASILVEKVRNEKELATHLTHSFKVLDDLYKRDRGRGEKVMVVEEFIEGDMYSTDAYVDMKGQTQVLPFLRCYTAHEKGKDGFYTFSTHTKTSLTPEQVKTGVAAVTDAVHAVGLRGSVAHVELFYTKNGWMIIELGPRAGGQRHDIYLHAYGIDHALNEMRLKAGLPVDMKHYKTGHAATVNVYPETAGTIDKIIGLSKTRELASVKYINQNLKVGNYADLSQNGGKLVIDGLLSNENYNDLLIDLEKAQTLLQVSTN